MEEIIGDCLVNTCKPHCNPYTERTQTTVNPYKTYEPYSSLRYEDLSKLVSDNLKLDMILEKEEILNNWFEAFYNKEVSVTGLSRSKGGRLLVSGSSVEGGWLAGLAKKRQPNTSPFDLLDIDLMCPLVFSDDLYSVPASTLVSTNSQNPAFVRIRLDQNLALSPNARMVSKYDPILGGWYIPPFETVKAFNRQNISPNRYSSMETYFQNMYMDMNSAAIPITTNIHLFGCSKLRGSDALKEFFTFVKSSVHSDSNVVQSDLIDSIQDYLQDIGNSAEVNMGQVQMINKSLENVVQLDDIRAEKMEYMATHGEYRSETLVQIDKALFDHKKPSMNHIISCYNSKSQIDMEKKVSDWSNALGKNKDSGDIKQDTVPCLAVDGWPEVAREWTGRARQWPPPEVVKMITQQGCHLVKKVSEHTDPMFEWRLSFSLAEKKLMRSMNLTQKKCFQSLKIIYNQEMREYGGISSYHIKITVLWACEQLPVHIWTEANFARCLDLLLDIFVACLHRDVPMLHHYFIPNVNLLDNITIEQKNMLIDKIRSCRENPYKLCSKICDKDVYEVFNTVTVLGSNHIFQDILNTRKQKEFVDKLGQIFTHKKQANRLNLLSLMVSIIACLCIAGWRAIYGVSTYQSMINCFLLISTSRVFGRWHILISLTCSIIVADGLVDLIANITLILLSTLLLHVIFISTPKKGFNVSEVPGASSMAHFLDLCDIHQTLEGDLSFSQFILLLNGILVYELSSWSGLFVMLVCSVPVLYSYEHHRTVIIDLIYTCLPAAPLKDFRIMIDLIFPMLVFGSDNYITYFVIYSLLQFKYNDKSELYVRVSNVIFGVIVCFVIQWVPGFGFFHSLISAIVLGRFWPYVHLSMNCLIIANCTLPNKITLEEFAYVCLPLSMCVIHYVDSYTACSLMFLIIPYLDHIKVVWLQSELRFKIYTYRCTSKITTLMKYGYQITFIICLVVYMYCQCIHIYAQSIQADDVPRSKNNDVNDGMDSNNGASDTGLVTGNSYTEIGAMIFSYMICKKMFQISLSHFVTEESDRNKLYLFACVILLSIFFYQFFGFSFLNEKTVVLLCFAVRKFLQTYQSSYIY